MTEALTLAALRSDPSHILNFYFEALEKAYVKKSRRAKAIPGHPGSKQIFYFVKPWSVTDTWHTTSASDFSGGSTHIYFEGKLVWMMQYFGHIPDELIPLQRQAWAAEYEQRRWNGGRGPNQLVFKEQGLIYHNVVGEKGFERFHGIETLGPALQPHTPQNSGWQRYQGGVMF